MKPGDSRNLCAWLSRPILVMQRVGADPRVSPHNPPPATRGACPPPPAGDTRAPARSDPGAVHCPPRAGLNRVPTRTSALPGYLSSVGGRPLCLPAQSTPGHAGRVSTPARGGHKSPSPKRSRPKKCLGYQIPNEVFLQKAKNRLTCALDVNVPRIDSCRLNSGFQFATGCIMDFYL